MKTQKIILIFQLFFISFCCSAKTILPPSEIIKKLQVPPGFKISIFASNLPSARSMALGDNGVVFVGTNDAGSVYAVRDANGDGVAESKYTIARYLNTPNGVAYKNGSLYVAEISKISRYDNIIQRLASPPWPVPIYRSLPTAQHHGWKYLNFGPDGKLYTAVGAPCNICDPNNSSFPGYSPVYATLVRLNPDGSRFEIIAKGIRNSVGFDWQPGTNALYFTENGRDKLKNPAITDYVRQLYYTDNSPSEELNRWSGRLGEHFGYPYCHAGSISDPEIPVKKSCSLFTSPVWKFRPHNAPLGMKFYRGNRFPWAYRNRLFVAMHGSWNRSVPDGYRITMLNVNGSSISYAGNFVTGWLRFYSNGASEVIGRPVDVLEMKDGSLLISDDYNGLIYRVTYTG